MFRRLALATTLACALAVTAGCAPEPEPTPSSTALFSSKQEAFAAAEKTYRAYVDALNKVDLSDPATFQDVYKWETGDAEDADKKNLTTLHSKNATKSGNSVIQSLDLGHLNADRTSVTLYVCVDVSTVEVRDKHGKSLVNPNRPDVQRTAVTVAATNKSRSSMLVTGVTGRTEGGSC